MLDLLQVLSQFTATRGAVKEVHLVETSQSMRQAQEARLSSATSRLGCKLIWHDMIEDIPEDNTVYTMLLAHEFFDALPFHLLEVRLAHTSTRYNV